tara:strand:- start:1436 stop:2998 length:1563 start_codon:yes stop_codon:yes gene_type:complete
MLAHVPTLVDLVRHQGRALPDKAAFLCATGTASYGLIEARSRHVAAALRAAGIKPGDRVAYLARNSLDYYELLFGAVRAGAVFMPVNWRLSDAEIAYVLTDGDARILFGEAHHIERIAAARAQLLATIEIGIDTPNSIYADWRDAADISEWQDHAPDPDEVAMQFYTSGTTGHPKGAMLSHQNLLALRNLHKHEQPEWYRWEPDDVSILPLPLFHIGTAAWGVTGFHYGATSVILAEFDAAKVIEAIARYRVTLLSLVPVALQMVIEHEAATRTDFSSIRYTYYGAAPMPLSLLRRAMATLRCQFVQVYGMTEATGTIVGLRPEDHDAQGSPRMEAAGQGFPGVELAVIDGDGNFVPDGAIGEIVTRSVANMVGYYKRPEATAETIRADGWLHTGDAGHVENGYVYVRDRIKEMIISGGENIYPAEVEAAICAHSSVLDVAVFGIPDDRWGETVHAAVSLHPGVSVTADEIIQWTRERIAAFKAPRSIDFVEVVPRNASGKLLRKELREPYWSGREKRIN